MAEFEHINGLEVAEDEGNFQCENPNNGKGPTDNTPSKRLKPTNKIINRLILCMFATVLLWATSLEICSSIVNSFIAIPTFNSVYEQCSYTYSVMQEEQQAYSDCVSIQLAACNKFLRSAYRTELARVASNEDSNQALLAAYTNLVGNCTSDMATAKASFSAWTNLNGLYYAVPYKATCSGAQKDAVQSLLGDSSGSSNSIYATMTQYTLSSDTTVGHLATYSVALNSYNAHYVNNKTKALQNLAHDLVANVSLPQIAGLHLSLNVSLTKIVNGLLACTSMTNATGICAAPQNLRELYLEDKAYIDYIFGNIKAWIVRNTAVVAAFNARLLNALASMNSFYEAVMGAQGVITWIVKNSGWTGASLCGKSSPNFCTFTPSDWTMGVLDVGYPSVDSMRDISFYTNAMKGPVNSARQQIQTLAAEVTAEMLSMVGDVQAAIARADFSPSDYNPPRYSYSSNASTEATQQSARTETFLTDVHSILTAKVNTSNLLKDISFTYNTSTSVSSSILSHFTTSWSGYSVGGIDFSLLLESLLTIKGLLFLFDYLYRIFQTVRLVSRFWSRGVVKLPKGDVRSRREDTTSSPILPYIGYALQLLPFLWLQLLLFILLIGFLAWGIAAILVPEYYGYMGACVHHTTNSTFLSRAMNAGAYNYAALDGNSDIAKGMVSYNVLTAEHCAVNYQSSHDDYSSLVKSMLSTNQSLTSNIDSMASVEACVNLTALSQNFGIACCGQSGYSSFHGCAATKYQCPISDTLTGLPYLSPGAYLKEPQCRMNTTARLQFATDPSTGTLALSNHLGSVRDSVFQCSALPDCQVTCPGPNRKLIALMTKACSCMVEWYFNGYVLQISIAMVAYILMNVSRSLICTGLIRIHWKTLTPKVFDFSANCDAEGHFIPHAQVLGGNVDMTTHRHAKKQSKSDNDTVDSFETEVDEIEAQAGTHSSCSSGGIGTALEAALRRDLDAKIRRFVRGGYAYIALGVVCNGPWMFLLYAMKRNMTYTPDPN